MSIKHKNQDIFKAKGIIIVLALTLLFVLEPVYRERSSFAITLFDNPKVSSTQINNPQIESAPANPQHTRQKSHAPEPSTLILILSGMCGMIIRFARRSFNKFKRVLDLFFSAVGLTLAAPILVLSGALIKMTSKGPIIYKQNRVGKDGKIFKIYKLRTMRVDAEKNSGAVWAKENDPRVMPVGRILRKIHLDEIPQLLNVINGDMSIVGPRPERPEMVRDLRELIVDYEKRLVVKPGITGLAQVFHKYDETIEDVKKKVKYDLLYIKKMCWLVEMRILARTFVVALTGKGAR